MADTATPEATEAYTTETTESRQRSDEGGAQKRREDRQKTPLCLCGVMRCVLCFCVSVLLWTLGVLCGVVAAAEESVKTEPATVRRTEANLHFQVPPDWPIEERGGIVAPIPVEEYLARKFKALESQLRTIEQRLNGLDLRLRVLEEGTRRQPTLKSSETLPP
jgi:hypothetical protein